MTFWSGKRVLVTGHTGFKGSWLSNWLLDMGADVFGLALAPEDTQVLFGQLHLDRRMDHAEIDLRDADATRHRILDVQPDIVFHLAASSVVLKSYEAPIEAWATNVMGSLHLMEALRSVAIPCAAIMATTDKVYENREWAHPYRESDRLGGKDPYSASKAAMELAISSWRDSFFGDLPVSLATVRAGNVIGGGDWTKNRIVPDIVRALQSSTEVGIRNPNSVRPFQHVLEPLSGYLRLAERMHSGEGPVSNAYNFGPAPEDAVTVAELVETALTHWPGRWVHQSVKDAPHEAGLLSLGTDLARTQLGYRPRWDCAEGIARTITWYRQVHEGADALETTREQIKAFGAP